MSALSVLALASVYGFMAVVLGAFGAHGLRDRISADMLAVWHTGVQYQFYHSLALLLVALLMLHWPHNGHLRHAAVAFGLGILLFSGSLYLLSTLSWRWLGPVTPLGGLSFLVGWFFLLLAAWRQGSLSQ